MEWNFELTEPAARALYAQYFRQNKTSGRLLRAMGAVSAAVVVWVALRAGQQMMRPGYFYAEFDPVGGALYMVLALVMLALTVWLFWRSRAVSTAAAMLRRLEKMGASPLGQWHLRLDEDKLVYSRAGRQEACDPSVIQKTGQYPEGLLIWLYGGARVLMLPASAFEGPEAMAAAAAEFERCAALAKARLFEQSARQMADPGARQELPPCPPLPEGETQMFAAPVVLRPDEVKTAFYAANRRLNPIGKGRLVLLWVLLIAALLEVALAVATGDAALAVTMGALAVLLALLLAARSPAAQRAAMKRQLEGEQTQRLATPGWVVLGQNGFTATSGALCSYRPYSSLNAVAQDENYIFLRFEGNMITAIPKRGFEGPGQASEAFAFLRQKRAGQKRGRSGQ